MREALQWKVEQQPELRPEPKMAIAKYISSTRAQQQHHDEFKISQGAMIDGGRLDLTTHRPNSQKTFPLNEQLTSLRALVNAICQSPQAF